MDPERSSGRVPYHRFIEYTAVALKDGKLRFLDLMGRAINISTTGLCFITRYPLKAGDVIEFKNRVLNCSHGVVMWIRRLGGIYIAGTRLIKKNQG